MYIACILGWRGGGGVPLQQTLQVCKFFIQLLGVVLKTLIKCQADRSLLRRRSFGSSRTEECVTSQKNVCVGG